MTLIRCKECGVDVSDKAKYCQNCGAPVTRLSKSIIGYLLTTIVTLLIVVPLLIGRENAQNTQRFEKQDSSLKTQAMQAKRRALIDQLIDRGIFHKVETPSTLPYLWTTPLFDALNFDDKETFVNVVYAYYITRNPKADIVILKDSRTGKDIGKYAAVYGGLKLD